MLGYHLHRLIEESVGGLLIATAICAATSTSFRAGDDS
jgi:hypothetical protein